MRSRWLTLALLIALSAMAASGQSASIARWHNNATAAYSMVLDDFGMSHFADVATIDSLLANRGLALSIAAVAESLTGTWVTRAQLLASHGNEFVNHSWNHSLTFTADSFALEMDSSKARIERLLPGTKCLFMCFPVDNCLPARITYLRTREYIGARCVQTYGTNAYNLADPFNSRYIGYGDGDGVTGLNSLVDSVISRGGWALRSAHNVGDTAGQVVTTILTAVFRSHLDYVVSKEAAGRLWMAPVQQVIMYLEERDHYSVSITGQSVGSITVGFSTSAVKINPSALVDNTLYNRPLTLLLDLPAGFADATVNQNGGILTHVSAGANRIMFDAAPYGGPVSVTSSTAALAGRAGASAGEARTASGLHDLRGRRTGSGPACRGLAVAECCGRAVLVPAK